MLLRKQLKLNDIIIISYRNINLIIIFIDKKISHLSHYFIF